MEDKVLLENDKIDVFLKYSPGLKKLKIAIGNGDQRISIVTKIARVI